MLSTDKSQNITHSISRATDILLCLSRYNNTITGIAAYTHLSVSTVHRILKTLEELNWVKQDRLSRNYYLGPLISELSSNPLACHQYLIVNSLSEMVRLSEITGETINLGTMIDLNYFRLHEIPSHHNLRVMEGSPYGLPIKGATGNAPTRRS